MLNSIKKWLGIEQKGDTNYLPEHRQFDLERGLDIPGLIQLDKYGKPTFWSLDFLNFDGKTVPTDELLQEGYLNPYFFIVIDRLATISARLERYYVDKQDPERDVTGIDEIETLLMKPNASDYCEDFMYRIYASYMATGEAFVFGLKPEGFNRYSKLYVANPANVTVTHDRYGEPERYTINFHETSEVLPAEEVLHITKPNITRDTDRGLSPLAPNRFPYKSNNEIWQGEYFLHKNKGVNGILTNDGKRAMTPAEKQSMQSQFDKDTQGRNFSKIKVTSESVKFIQMGTNPNDLKSIEARLDHLRQACATFHVSSQMFGDPASSTYNNMEQAKVGMYTDAILPMCRKIDTELSIWLIQRHFNFQNIVWKVDKEKITSLNKPNHELSTKLINEVNAGVIPASLAAHLLYPDYYEEPNLNEDVSGQE